QSHRYGHRGFGRRDPRAHRSLPQGRPGGLRTRLDDHQDRRPQRCVEATRGEGRGSGAAPRPKDQDLAGACHRESPMAATVAAIAPKANVAAPTGKVGAGAKAIHRSPATTPDANFTAPTHECYAPRPVAMLLGGAKAGTTASCGPS